MGSWNRRLLALLTGALVVAGCNKLFPVDVGTSQGKGVVRRVDYQNHMVTLDHGLIPNLLQAMTFAYPIQRDSMMNGILPEDTVLFTLTEPSPGNFVVQSLQKVGSPKHRDVPVFPDEIATTTTRKITRTTIKSKKTTQAPRDTARSGSAQKG